MALIRLFFLVVLFNIWGIQEALAEETDQFTLPPAELLDIGPTTSHKLFETIKSVVDQTNSEIQMLLPRAKHSRLAASKLAARLNDVYLADLLYQKTGPGFPRWMRGNR